MTNLNARLRRVDLTLAQIDRRLGFLQGRAYFQALGATTFTEVLIFDFHDEGASAKKLETEESVYAHRFTIRVDRDWIEANQESDGATWAVSRDEGVTLIPCEKESEVFQDGDTFATMTLRISQALNNYVGY